ncbi:hypothetical protein FYK55_12325 [Roseiconus nitratireducens]|uniref:Uncharacterized protein n=1 Tax=Roseiconus nitratireducens TaxID=2605748 RepID=A0A5M6D9G5_9BACT|nr:hypothetical protein [Roseiconus nitratireducens]KAA5543070.1 hypothetical protein FYK55_12325 [Roseiconus nitratireducens]
MINKLFVNTMPFTYTHFKLNLMAIAVIYLFFGCDQSLGQGTITARGSVELGSVVDDTEVGRNADGFLGLEDGAQVFTSGVDVGIGGVGDLFLSGIGTNYQSGGTASVGFLNVGRLTIEDGASFRSKAMEIGDRSGSTGFVEVNGRVSRLSVGNEIVIGKAGLGEMRLSDGGNVTTAKIAVNGRLAGDGTISGIRGDSFGGVQVSSSGEITSAAGENLSFIGGVVTNLGRIESIGTTSFLSEMTFDSSVTSSGQIISRNAVMRFDGGLTNEGDLLASFGTSDIQGDINNTGRIIVTGGAQATFYDDIVQNGTLRVSATDTTSSVAVFAGDFSGSGGATGGGDIFFEGGFSPGNSPGLVEYDTDLFFSPSSMLEFELAGLEPGTEYDRVVVNGDVVLDGTLDVLLLDDFDPLASSIFDIVIADSIQDNGTEFQFPTLDNGRLFSSSIFTSGNRDILRLTVTAIPEPGTTAVLLMLSCFAFVNRPRRKATAVRERIKKS